MVSGWGAWFCVALGGALGSVARVGLISVMGAKYAAWGVALVNLLGAFAFACVLSVSIRSMPFELPLKALLLSGFMGAFTTFSTFTFEAWQMLQAGAWFAGCCYVVVNVLGSLCAFVLGLWLMGYTPA